MELVRCGHLMNPRQVESGSGGVPPGGDALLLEDGSFILLEDGTKVLME